MQETINVTAALPTGPFSISESRDQETGECFVTQQHRATDFEAYKLCKGRTGTAAAYPLHS